MTQRLMSRTLISINRLLQQAERQYLLESKTLFQFPISHTQEIREDYGQFERFLAQHPFLKVTKFRNEKDGHIKIGRACEVEFSLSDLLKRRPQLQQITQAWELAKQVAASAAPSGEDGVEFVTEFIRSHFSECYKKSDSLTPCIRILFYLRNHPEEVYGLYPRQIPHGASTKLIGTEALLLQLYRSYKKRPKAQWSDFFLDFKLKEKPLSFSFFSDAVRYDGFPLRDFEGLLSSHSVCSNVSRWDFSQVQGVLIVENEESFYPLRKMLPCFLILFGSGRKVCAGHFLKDLFAGIPVYYWGDLDKDGYEILNSVRAFFPAVRPICMGQRILDEFRHLRQLAPVSPMSPVSLMSPDFFEGFSLRNEYSQICLEGIQIEQEQIPLSWVIKEVMETF